jgi:hypothetical protein
MKQMSYGTALTNAIEGNIDAETIARLTDLRESLAKRNSRKSDKPTKAQVANAELGENIVNTLEVGVDYTCSDIGKMFGGLTSQKISPIMKALVADGRVTSDKVKGKTVYRLA